MNIIIWKCNVCNNISNTKLIETIIQLHQIQYERKSNNNNALYGNR